MMLLWYGSHWSIWQALLVWVGMVVVSPLIFIGVFLLIAEVIRKPENAHPNVEAHRILDQRLARGEIGVEEYHRLVNLIDGGDPAEANEKIAA